MLQWFVSSLLTICCVTLLWIMVFRAATRSASIRSIGLASAINRVRLETQKMGSTGASTALNTIAASAGNESQTLDFLLGETDFSSAVLDMFALNLLHVEHSIEMEKARTECKKVVLTLSDLAYKDGFANWYAMVDQPRGCALIVSLGDGPTCAYLREQEFPSICMQIPKSLASFYSFKGSYSNSFQSRFAVGLAKIIYPLIFLANHRDVLISEMDVFWKSNCFSELYREDNLKYDIQTSSHVVNPTFATARGEINIGFLLVRSTTASIQTFYQMLRYTILHPTPMGAFPTYDQKLFDRFIRFKVPEGDEPSQWHALFPNDVLHFESSLKTPWHLSLQWRRLPVELYVHNIGSKLLLTDKTITVHISFGIGEPVRRVYCAHRLGLISPAVAYAAPTLSVHFCFEIYNAQGIFLKTV